MRVFKGLGKCTHAETIIASQLAATAAKDQGWVGVPNAKSIGWAIYAAGFDQPPLSGPGGMLV